jgi:mRNA interferase HicA
VKLADLERHLRANGCELYREGSRHAVWWNPANRKTTAVPRHREIKNPTAWAICKALEIEKP